MRKYVDSDDCGGDDIAALVDRNRITAFSTLRNVNQTHRIHVGSPIYSGNAGSTLSSENLLV
jgi:hypothetical protein